MEMGLIGRLEEVNSYSKKQCKRLFWKVKTAVRKAVRNRAKQQQQQLKFQYDPLSYALNFDDGCRHFVAGDRGCGLRHGNNEDGKTIVWVYVLRVES